MTTSIELEKIRDEVSHKTLEKRNFKRRIEDLLKNVDDHCLDEINSIRGVVNSYTDQIEKICQSLQGLTWTVTNPTHDQLTVINEIIILGRFLFTASNGTKESLRPLWSNGVIKAEIDEFTEVCEHCSEIIDDIESVYFGLPDNQDFIDTLRELEQL